MSTNATRSVFHGSVRGSDLTFPGARPGTVYIALTDPAATGVRVRIVGTSITAHVLAPDKFTGLRRIVLVDQLGENTVQVDTFANADLSMRSVIAIAEGMLRGLALSFGVDLVDGPETPES